LDVVYKMSQEAFHYIDKPQTEAPVAPVTPPVAPVAPVAPTKPSNSHRMMLIIILILAILALIYGGYCMYKNSKTFGSTNMYYF
jgi:hypothetical protein